MLKIKNVLKDLYNILEVLQLLKNNQYEEFKRKLNELRSDYGIIAYSKQVEDTKDLEYYETICRILREIAIATK